VTNRTTDVSSVGELNRFVATAAPGDVAIYHSGNLAFDRDEAGPFKADKKMFAAIDALARAVWELAAQGSVFLGQRRVGPGICDYLAIRSGAGSARHNQIARDEEKVAA
jgi:hypothetical protein